MKRNQLPLFEAQTTWFHVFKSMIDNGDLKKIGPHAVTVYLVIKSYTNWKTGKSWPGVELIAEKSGISLRKVNDCLKVLVENDYLRKEKKGRKNFYTLREKVPFFEKGDDLRPIAEATWDYLPSKIKEAVAELKNFQVSGDPGAVQIIHIEQLVLNLQHNEGNATGNQNIVSNSGSVDWESVPDDNPVKRARDAFRKQDKESNK